MGQIDKTRENIRARELEEAKRKELFDKFVNAGGKVVKEKRAKPMVFDRAKQRALAEKLDQHHRSRKEAVKKSASVLQTAVGSDSMKGGGNVIDALLIRLSLWFSGITGLSGRSLKNSFLTKFNDEYKTALIELQMLYLDIFRQSPTAGEKIIYQLDQMKPLFYELIEMTADLYDRIVLSQLLDHHQAFPDDTKYTNEYRTPLLAYFKKIYPLYPYMSAVYTAYERAIALQEKQGNEKSSTYSAKRKKANNGLYVLFNKLLPRLYKLFCYYHGESVPIDSYSRIEEILMIGPDLKPGMRTASAPSRFSENYDQVKKDTRAQKEEEQKEGIEELKKKHKVEIPDDVKRGLLLMKGLDYNLLKNAYVPANHPAQYVQLPDPVLRAYLLFLEFDREYSFVLTTSKIKYNIFFDKADRKDFKTIMNDLFNSMRSCEEAAKQYFIASEFLKRAQEEEAPREYYLTQAKKIAELERDKKLKTTSARNTFVRFMDNIAENLEIILADARELKRIVQNPADIIEYDPELNLNLKLTGRSVVEAIQAVHDYATAYSFRLSAAGDIFRERKEGEQKSAGETPGSAVAGESEAAAPQEPAAAPPEQDYNPEEKGSILGELDKLDDLV
jgi:hypothetical protein